MSILEINFHKIVETAVANSVSDIHFRSGEKPCYRMKGDLVSVKVKEFQENDIVDILKIITKESYPNLDIKNTKELDGSFEVKGSCRLRFNYLKFQGKSALIFRVISMQIPTIDELGLADVVKDISLAKNGLILVTGATGSGKSSTLAAMIDHINKNRSAHIITLEDPVEYLHQSNKSKITQREIGIDTEDFNTALRSSLRQDPDILLIGEMRDTQTITTAIKAAETGHLVFGTVHTVDALNTVGRLISMFPVHEQDSARIRIADNLHATISQRLIKTIDNKSMIAAQEIMISTPGINEAIKNPKKIEEIYTYIEKGYVGLKSQSFDQHITQLYREGLISLDEAKNNASSPDDFERNLIFTKEN